MKETKRIVHGHRKVLRSGTIKPFCSIGFISQFSQSQYYQVQGILSKFQSFTHIFLLKQNQYLCTYPPFHQVFCPTLDCKFFSIQAVLLFCGCTACMTIGSPSMMEGPTQYGNINNTTNPRPPVKAGSEFGPLHV